MRKIMKGDDMIVLTNLYDNFFQAFNLKLRERESLRRVTLS